MRPAKLAASAATLLTTAMILTAPVALAETGQARTAQAQTAHQRYESQAFAATNHQRDRRDLHLLHEQRCVQKHATRWARHMARTERLVHQALRPVLRDCQLHEVGENIAYGYATGRSVVNDGWMHSEGHRENILRPSYRLMGIGARRDDSGRWWVSQVFGRK